MSYSDIDDINEKLLSTLDKLDITGWEDHHDNFVDTIWLTRWWDRVINSGKHGS